MRCPKCGSLNTKRYGKRKLTGSKKTVVRISCAECHYVGSVRSLARLHEENTFCLELTRESLERASVRILARRYKKSKTTIMNIVHRVTSELGNSQTIAKQFRPQWSGVLIFDGKVVRVFDENASRLDKTRFTENELRWMHKRRWLCGIDFETGDLPHYALHEAESKVDLVLYFQELKSLQYPLKAVVCDGNPEIPYAAKHVFGNSLVIQRCTRHFLEDLRKLLPSKTENKQKRLLCEQVIRLIKFVIEADNLDHAQKQNELLLQFTKRKRNLVVQTMMQLFEENKEALCAHLTHPELNLPHTSNDIENLFRQLNLRLKSVGRFFHQRYAKDYLNAWALLRRFTPFTDCRKTRRYRNGHSPLELAGANIHNINPLNLKK